MRRPLDIEVSDLARAQIRAARHWWHVNRPRRPTPFARNSNALAAHLRSARDLRVSQATVRQALLQLEQLGLVVRTPNIGTHVTRMSPQEVRERVELRLVLEERALAAAAPRMTPDAFADLDVRLADLSAVTARNAYFDQARADLEFHRYIWRQADNRTLYRTLDQLAVPLFAFVSILRGSNRQTLADVVQSHEGIVQALRSGDPVEIHSTLRDHLIFGFSLPDE